MIKTEITNAIADIEKRRRVMQEERGAAAACSEALRRLHELLGGGTGGKRAANIEVVAVEIERVKRLAGVDGKGVMPKHAPPQAQKHVGPSQAHNAPRNKGRRTMGRTSGR